MSLQLNMLNMEALFQLNMSLIYSPLIVCPILIGSLSAAFRLSVNRTVIVNLTAVTAMAKKVIAKNSFFTARFTLCHAISA